MSDVEGQLKSTIVKEMVQAILMLDYSKKPFKQSDIMSHISQKPPRKLTKEYVEKAKEKLLDLGVKLIETKEAPKSFILVSKEAPTEIMHKYAGKEERANRSLLAIVLLYILVKNKKAESGEIFNHLRNLGICEAENSVHPYFGNVKKKILHEFVDQLYLSASKLPDSDVYDITWGVRAEAEVSIASMVDFAKKIGYSLKIN